MKKLMIDAGHGPNTPGKRSPDGSLREFEFNSRVANYVKQFMPKSKAIILFSHDPFRDVPLNERISLANRLHVDAFVSIHANAFQNNWNEANGIETYTYIHPLAASQKLAETIQTNLIHLTMRKNRGVKRANFAVLRETKMPAVLVECGFMTNREEAALLKSDDYAKLCARGIVAGIIEWM